MSNARRRICFWRGIKKIMIKSKLKKLYVHIMAYAIVTLVITVTLVSCIVLVQFWCNVINNALMNILFLN